MTGLSKLLARPVILSAAVMRSVLPARYASSSANKASTGLPIARASLSASVVDGTNTLFSTVLIVLRLTPTRSASSACVQPSRARSSRRVFVSRSAILERAAFEQAEAQQRGGDADRHQHADRFASVDRGEQREDVAQDRPGHREQEAELEPLGAIGLRALVVHQRANTPPRNKLPPVASPTSRMIDSTI